MAANSTEGSFRPNAAYTALIVSTADIVLPPEADRLNCPRRDSALPGLNGVGSLLKLLPFRHEVLRSRCRRVVASREFQCFRSRKGADQCCVDRPVEGHRLRAVDDKRRDSQSSEAP